MLQQSAWTFRYSLEGFLKRVLHKAAGPQSESELIESVLADWAGEDEKSRESIPARVRASLQARNGAFQKQEQDRYVLRTQKTDDLCDRAYRYLQETGVPKKHGDILRHLQQVTGRGRGDLMSRVDLDNDPRFVRLEGGEWLLTEWELVHDAIVNLMVDLGQRRAGREDLLTLIAEEDELRGKHFIFQPELDPRFAVVGDQVDCLLLESEATASVEKTDNMEEEPTTETEERQMNDITTAFENAEVAATAEAVETVETTENRVSTSEFVDNALLQLAGICADVQRRNEEVPNEVVTLFNLEDIEGIQSLMLQRKRIAALAEDLQAFIAKWSDEIDAK